MARTRADLMADYLESLVREGGGSVEIQRGALAARFGCAPSQVNYVLATRFTLAHGYVLESRPGQGGYIRIRALSGEEWRALLPVTLSSHDVVHRGLGQEEALRAVDVLEAAGLLTAREAALLRAVVDREVLRIALPERDRLRARLLRAALAAAMPRAAGVAGGRR
jgi:transcriptional regulator CtsR